MLTAYVNGGSAVERHIQGNPPKLINVVKNMSKIVFERTVVHFYAYVPLQVLNTDNLTSSLLTFFLLPPPPFYPFALLPRNPKPSPIHCHPNTLFLIEFSLT